MGNGTYSHLRNRVRKAGVLLRRIDPKATMGAAARTQGGAWVRLDDQAWFRQVRADDRGPPENVPGAGGQDDVLAPGAVRVALRPGGRPNGYLREKDETLAARIDGVTRPD